MYDYETLTVFHPDLGEAGSKELAARVRAVLEGGKAEIKKVDEWGMRELAYSSTFLISALPPSRTARTRAASSFDPASPRSG